MKYRFCPICGSALILPFRANTEKARSSCSKCDFIHYANPKPCVCAVVIRKGKVLLARRANEPFRDHWDFPGGFLESGERPEDGLRREIDEELKIGIRILRVLGIYPDTYGPGGEATLNIYYLCKIARGEITPVQTEVAAVKWFLPNALPQKLAFGHVELVLQEWRKLQAKKRLVLV